MSADRQQLYTALRNADKAGDVEGAKKIAAYIKSLPSEEAAKPATKPKEEGGTAQTLGNIAGGLTSGAAQIGATALAPVDWLARKLGVKDEALFPTDRRAAIESGLREMGAQPESMAFKAGQLGAEIAGTAGAGGLLARGTAGALPTLAKYAPRIEQALSTSKGIQSISPQLASAVASGGFKLAQPAANKLAGLATRAAGGAISGGAMAGMVRPEDALTGAAIGGAMPGAVQGAGALGRMVGNKLIPKATQEVADLAQKAKTQYKIDVPADRIADSKTLNALTSSMEYVPFSGRAASVEKMHSQINQAVSRTIGQDSANITDALRKASADLGSKFDDVLKNNTVKVDNEFLNALASHADTAAKELESGQAKIIQNQIDEIIAKASQTGEIDGQAAYNIKKTLDRISKQNSPTAYYAKDLKMSLMDALNRSLGPEEAAKFAKVRQQYGNMLTLEKLAPAGAEGEISMGRLANLRNVRDPELRDLVDIAAQFGRSREAPHSAQQRVWAGGGLAALGLSTGTLPMMAAGIAGSRAANAALNSQMVKNAMLGQGSAAPGAIQNMLANPAVRAALAQSNP